MNGGREIYLGPQAQSLLEPFLKPDLMSYLFSPQEADRERRAAQREARKTPVQPSQQNRRTKSPKRPPGERYTVQSYRRAIVTACEAAFDMPRELRKSFHRMTKAEKKRFSPGEWKAELKRRQERASEWRSENCWHPNQLRHNAATKARRTAGLEAAQIICGHAKADVTQVYAEADRAKAMEYMVRYG